MSTESEKLAAITALAEKWAHQPNDYDEDTETQINDGHDLLYILRGVDLTRCQVLKCEGQRCERMWHACEWIIGHGWQCGSPRELPC
jgi:hypothetical protein